MLRSSISGILFAAFLLLSGCTQRPADETSGPQDGSLQKNSLTAGAEQALQSEQSVEPIPVVASFSILEDWIREVGGDRITITTLVGPGADAHTYEPTPRDAAAVSQARLIFEIGLEFETWLDGLVESSEGSARRIVVSRSLKPRQADPTTSHHEVDPHVWHDPILVMEMIREIERALSETDPKHAADFAARASAYIVRLESLHDQIKNQVESIPLQHRHLVTTHDTFGYFADRYGFRVSSVLGAVSSEITDPSAAQVAELVDQLKSEKTPAVFTENMINPELTQQVAAEAQVRIVTELHTDALGPKGSTGDSYIRLMESNIAVIAEALCQ